MAKTDGYDDIFTAINSVGRLDKVKEAWANAERQSKGWFGSAKPIDANKLLRRSYPDGKQGCTSFLHAVAKFAHGGQDIAHFLVSKGANVNLRVDDGWAPLHWAAHNGHQDVVASLIDAGADVDAADASGKAALEHASEAGHDRVARVLRDSGG